LGQRLGPNHAQGPIHGPHSPSSPSPSRGPITRSMLKKDPIGLHSRWPKPTWASHALHMGQRRCEDLKRFLKEQ